MDGSLISFQIWILQTADIIIILNVCRINICQVQQFDLLLLLYDECGRVRMRFTWRLQLDQPISHLAQLQKVLIIKVIISDIHHPVAFPVWKRLTWNRGTQVLIKWTVDSIECVTTAITSLVVFILREMAVEINENPVFFFLLPIRDDVALKLLQLLNLLIGLALSPLVFFYYFFFLRHKLKQFLDQLILVLYLELLRVIIILQVD